jgi:hypothetical protein
LRPQGMAHDDRRAPLLVSSCNPTGGGVPGNFFAYSPSSANAVHPSLVCLHLLKGDADRTAQPGLRDALLITNLADSFANRSARPVIRLAPNCIARSTSVRKTPTVPYIRGAVGVDVPRCQGASSEALEVLTGIAQALVGWVGGAQATTRELCDASPRRAIGQVSHGSGYPELRSCRTLSCTRHRSWRADRLPFDPSLVTPIAAPFVFTPSVVLTRSPTPIIGMHDDPCICRILVSLVCVPTGVPATDDFRRRVCHRQGRDCHAHCGANEDFADHFQTPLIIRTPSDNATGGGSLQAMTAKFQ